MKRVLIAAMAAVAILLVAARADAFHFGAARFAPRVQVNNFGGGYAPAAGFQFRAAGGFYRPRANLNFNFNSGYNYVPPVANFNFQSGYSAQGSCGGAVVQDPVTGRFFVVR